MLSGILKSSKAIYIDLYIIRSSVEIRKVFLEQHDVRALTAQLVMIKERLGEHGVQLNQIYDSIENLLDADAKQKHWEERTRIGISAMTVS